MYYICMINMKERYANYKVLYYNRMIVYYCLYCRQ